MNSPIKIRYAQTINTRLICEGATDLSDSELTRCLQGCVSGQKLIAIAQAIRDGTEYNATETHDAQIDA